MSLRLDGPHAGFRRLLMERDLGDFITCVAR